MKTIAIISALIFGFLEAASSDENKLGALRYREIRFDEVGFPMTIDIEIDFPSGIPNNPNVVVAYRENSVTNSPGRYSSSGGPVRPTRVLPNGQTQWVLYIDVNDVIEPGHFAKRGRNHWRIPILASQEMVFKSNQGLIPLLVMDDLVICVEVSSNYPADSLVTKWMLGGELASPSAFAKPEAGRGCNTQENESSARDPSAGGGPPTTQVRSSGVINGLNEKMSGAGRDRFFFRSIQFGKGGVPRRLDGILQLADNLGFGPVFVSIDKTNSNFTSLGSVGRSREVQKDGIWTYDVTLDIEHLDGGTDIVKESIDDWQILPTSSNHSILAPRQAVVPLVTLGTRLVCISTSNPYHCDSAIFRWITK